MKVNVFCSNLSKIKFFVHRFCGNFFLSIGEIGGKKKLEIVSGFFKNRSIARNIFECFRDCCELKTDFLCYKKKDLILRDKVLLFNGVILALLDFSHSAGLR